MSDCFDALTSIITTKVVAVRRYISFGCDASVLPATAVTSDGERVLLLSLPHESLLWRGRFFFFCCCCWMLLPPGCDTRKLPDLTSTPVHVCACFLPQIDCFPHCAKHTHTYTHLLCATSIAYAEPFRWK